MRWKLTLSYAGFLLVAWGSFIVVMMFVLHYIPDADLSNLDVEGGGFVPNRSDLIRAATPVAVAGTLTLLVVGLVGGWLLAGRMLRPLEAITAAAEEAAQGSLSHRIELAGPGDEFRRTADVFDAMLARLERAFDEQRRFTANASHELRTPLATTRTMLEVAHADRAGRDVDVLIGRLQEMNERSILTIEALLRLARIDQIDPTSDDCDLAVVGRRASGLVAKEATDHGVRIDLELAAAPMRGDRALLEHLVSNLLLNAIRHNLISGGIATLRTRLESGGRVRLEVENTGAVLDPALVATLAEPFVRGAGRIRSGPTGVGLGLSIVSSVALLHGGHLSLEARPAGGLLASVSFPAPIPPRAGSPTSHRAPGSVLAATRGTETRDAGAHAATRP